MSKLIVFEGVDGSGKSTQSILLAKYLQKDLKRSVLSLKFPQYESVYGRLIRRYLQGELGNIHDVSPYLISLVYALDRSLAKSTILHSLAKGEIVISDRYTPSNIAHHAAKIANTKERATFTTWLQNLEYKELGIPHENIVIYLSLPWDRVQELLTKREGHDGGDMHEKNTKYLKEVHTLYEIMAKKIKHWVQISCVDNQDHLLTPDAIHQKVKGALLSIV